MEYGDGELLKSIECSKSICHRVPGKYNRQARLHTIVKQKLIIYSKIRPHWFHAGYLPDKNPLRDKAPYHSKADADHLFENTFALVPRGISS